MGHTAANARHHPFGCRGNSGASLYPDAPRRGSRTFLSIEDHPADRRHPVAELAVLGGVPDVAEHVVRVERRHGARFAREGREERLPGYLAADPDTQRDAVVAAWLHDVLEDSPTTADALRRADLPERAVDAVVAFTRTDDVAPDEYYATIATKPVALLVKTADLASNLAPDRVAQLDDATRTRLDTKYTHALAQLGVTRDTIDTLHG